MLYKVSQLLTFTPKKKIPQEEIDAFLDKYKNKRFGGYAGDNGEGDKIIASERQDLSKMLMKYYYLPKELMSSQVYSSSLSYNRVSNFSCDFSGCKIASLEEICSVTDLLGYGMFPIQFLCDIPFVMNTVFKCYDCYSAITEFIKTIQTLGDSLNVYVLCPKEFYNYSKEVVLFGQHTKYLSPKLREEMATSEMMVQSMNMLYNMINQLAESLDQTKQIMGKTVSAQMTELAKATAMAKKALKVQENMSYSNLDFGQRLLQSYNQCGRCASVAVDRLRDEMPYPKQYEIEVDPVDTPAWAKTKTRLVPRTAGSIEVPDERTECLVFACPDLSLCPQDQKVIVGGDFGNLINETVVEGTDFSFHRKKICPNKFGIQ